MAGGFRLGEAFIDITARDRTAAGVAAAQKSVTAGAAKAAAAQDKQTASAARQAAAETRAAEASTADAAAKERLAAVNADLAGSSKAVQAATLRSIAAQERLNVVETSGTATAGRLASAQAGAIAASSRLEKTQGTLATRTTAVGKSFSKNVSLPIIAAAAASVYSAAKFDQATNVYVTAAGESEKNLNVVRQGIKNVAIETGTSIDNLTSAEYLLEKAGYRGAAGTQVLSAAAKGAREENANLADVIQAETSIMASYHIGANRAVEVTNALKTGAGEAKVTMEEFSKSLSTVIPIASANHISLQEVLGAEATLTQHGTSAAEATQELASTIRGLVSPNRVAQKEMQQLGLSVTDVTKNIGRRGLTGTINLLVGAVTKKMGASGLVIQNAFKQSKSASADLNVELAHMPKSLQSISEKFLSGKMGYADYNKSVKALGGNSYYMGKQLIATAAQAKGFNDLLKSGDPAAETFTSALKKMSGGAIGLNTILQLGGANMSGFKGRVNAVGKSLNDTSKDVEGWASTSKQASVKFDQFKQSLHVLAIDAGNTLLPTLTNIAAKGTSFISWIQNLSHTDKMIMGWSLGIAAAIGPVTRVFGGLIGWGARLGTVGTQLSTFAGASTKTAATIGRSMTMIGSALGGAAIGFAVGQLTKHASTGAKALGILGSAAAGAALGASAGPWGAALGGIAGGVTALITSWGGQSKAAQASAAAAKAALLDEQTTAQDLLSTLQSLNGAYNAQYKTAISSKLQTKGAYNAGDKVGVSSSTILNASLGNQAAMTSIAALGQKLADQYNKLAVSGAKIPKSLNDQITSYNKLADVLHIVQPAARDAERGLEQVNASMGKGEVPITLLKGGWSNLRKEMKQYGTTLNTNTAYGARNNEIIKESIAHLDSQAAKQIHAGKSVDSVSRAYSNQIVALRSTLVQMGFNSAAIDGLIGKYAKVPKTKTTTLSARTEAALAKTGGLQHAIDAIQQNKIPGLNAKSDQARGVIRQLQGIIDAIHGKTTTVGARVYGAEQVQNLAGTINAIHDKTVTVTTYSVNGGRGIVKAAATGTGSGGLADGWTSVGEGGPGARPELLYKKGPRVDIIPYKDAKLVAGVMNLHAPGLRPMTVATHASGTSAKASAKAERSTLTSDLKRQVSAVHTVTVKVNSTDAHEVLSNLYGDVNTLRGAVSTWGKDLQSAVNMMNGRTATSSRNTLRQFQRESAQLTTLAAKRTALINKIGTAPTASTDYDRLSAAQDAYTSTRTGVAGSNALDYSSAGNDGGESRGSVDRIVATQQNQLSSVKSFHTEINNLMKNKLNPTILGQIANAGIGGANAFALDRASAADITKINLLQSQITGESNAIGTAVASYINGASLTSAQKTLATDKATLAKDNKSMANINTTMDRQALAITGRLASYEKNMQAAGKHLIAGLNRGLADNGSISKSMKHMADSMINTLKRELGIHSPSAEGIAIGANYYSSIISGGEPHVNKAGKQASRMADAMMSVNPTAPANNASAASSTGGGMVIHNLTVKLDASSISDVQNAANFFKNLKQAVRSGVSS